MQKQFLSRTESEKFIVAFHSVYIQKVASAKQSDIHNFYDISSFQRHLLEFNDSQKRELSEIIDEIVASNWSWKPFFCLDNWTFILVNTKLEHGFPFTIHNSIVLPESFFRNDALASALAPDVVAKKRDIRKRIIIHERIHVLQKLHPSWFHDLYMNYWNCRLIDKPKLYQNERLNPDAVDVWAFQGRYIPWVKFIDSLANVEYKVGDYRSHEPESAEGFEQYYSFFNYDLSCYHVSEAAAELLEKIISNDVKESRGDNYFRGSLPESKAESALRKWIQQSTWTRTRTRNS